MSMKMFQADENEKVFLPSILTSAVSTTCTQTPLHQVIISGEAKKKVVRKRKRRRARSATAGDGEDREEEGKKRRLSDEQVSFLEKSFRNERKLESGRKVCLAMEAGLDPKQVAVWFQNRRARYKSKQLEQEYVKLKSMHDNTLVEKCHLQAEVVKLTQQLLEAENEITSLSCRLNSSCCGAGGGNNNGAEQSSSSPSTSNSLDTNMSLHGGELLPRVEELGFADEYNVPQNIYDWLNFYWM